MTALVGATTLLVLAAVLVACSPPESVALEAKGDPGADAFTENVASVEPDAYAAGHTILKRTVIMAITGAEDVGPAVAPKENPWGAPPAPSWEL